MCVTEQVVKEREGSVQRACIINEITLADGSHLGCVPQPLRFAAGSDAQAHTFPLLLNVPLIFYIFFHSVASFFSYSVFPSFPSSLSSSFIHRKIWPQCPGFQAKTATMLSPPHHAIFLCLFHSSSFHPFLDLH